MSSAASASVWVWKPVGAAASAATLDPSEIPVEAAAQQTFLEGKRGPGTCRIARATLLETRGKKCLIAERGATREIPTNQVLHFYEGLLILEELEALAARGAKVDWLDAELKAVLDQERAKYKSGFSPARYAETKLATVARTGPRFVDDGGKEWAHTREALRADANPGEGQDGGGFWRMSEITDHLPPWEAFCHEKCGLYQDFYKVTWAPPFSVVDYSGVENGCDNSAGATWEPDECLPSGLDALRVAAKRVWLAARKEKERRLGEERQRAQAQAAGKKRPPEPSPERQDSQQLGKRPRAGSWPPPKQGPPARLAQTKRDGLALDPDTITSTQGHDFAEVDPERLHTVRTGWPRAAADYPEGFSVCNPPGFCRDTCDCMDDQRLQHRWETERHWMEEAGRDAAALASVNNFAGQGHFAWRRGSHTGRHYIEATTTGSQDLTAAKAAQEFAGVVARAIRHAARNIPLRELDPSAEAVQLPSAAFLPEDQDYDPLRMDLAGADGRSPPSWLNMDWGTGMLSGNDRPAAQDVDLVVQFSHAEGPVGTALCRITQVQEARPWNVQTKTVLESFEAAPLGSWVRAVLREHLAEICDFKTEVAKDLPLGVWVDVMARVCRLARSVATAQVTPAQSGRPNGRN